MTRRHFGPRNRIEIGIAQFADEKRFPLPLRGKTTLLGETIIDHLTRRFSNRSESARHDT